MAQQLTQQDKEFIKLHTDGVKNSKAFKQAYPDHPAVIKWNAAPLGSEERQKYAEVIKDAAKTKLKTRYISRALTTYQDRMEEFSLLSLETAIELVQGARSEKVRSDLAIEGIRHRIGTPVQKIQTTEEQTVILQFGRPPGDESIKVHSERAEGSSSLIEGDDLDGTDDTTNTDTVPVAQTSLLDEHEDDSQPKPSDNSDTPSSQDT